MTEEPTFADLASDGIPFHLIPPFELSGIPIPLDIFDTLVNRYLPGLVHGWVDFNREEVTSGTVCYELRQSELGELGTIELFKTGVQELSMLVKSPPLPSVVPPKADKEDRPVTDVRQMWDERDALDRKRKDHQAQVIQTLFNRLAKDRAWQKHWREARDRWAKQRELKHFEKEEILRESRRQCSICGAKGFLELVHITPLAEGGSLTSENMMVLCPTCHMAVDSSRISVGVLREIKQDWVGKGILGKDRILDIIQGLNVTFERPPEDKTTVLTDLMSWAEALQSSEEFDACVQSIAGKISRIQSEDEFIIDILKPLFDALGYEGVTVLHHTGTPEHGKDIVFYERDRLGGFTFYAVVACAGKVHAKSSKAQTRDPGHYAKILDQIKKCFDLPYNDPNLKGDFYVDKVIVACSDSITDEALKLLRAWEDRERRRLIFLDSPRIAGHKLRLRSARMERG